MCFGCTRDFGLQRRWLLDIEINGLWHGVSVQVSRNWATVVETVEAMQKLYLRSTALQASLLRKTQGEYCWKEYTVEFGLSPCPRQFSAWCVPVVWGFLTLVSWSSVNKIVLVKKEKWRFLELWWIVGFRCPFFLLPPPPPSPCACIWKLLLLSCLCFGFVIH